MSVKYEIKDDSGTGTKIKILCNKCGTVANHQQLHNHLIRGEELYDAENNIVIDWYDDYQIIKCAGCDAISFRHESWFSEDHDYDSPESGVREILYPHRKKDGLRIQDHPNLPPTLKRIYRETIDCFNNESYMLTAAGLRALVEGLCAEVGVSGGPVRKADGTVQRKDNLEGKINGLAEKHILTEKDAESLHELRFLGNEALHQLGQHSPEELKLGAGLIEHILKSVFDLPKMQIDLRSKRYERMIKKKKSSD